MKKISLIALLMVVGIATLAAKGPTKKVLFTMNKNEEIYQAEYMAWVSNGKAQNYRYACFLQEASSLRYTLMWNGERKLKGLYTINQVANSSCTEDYTDMAQIDLDNFNNVVYLIYDDVSFHYDTVDWGFASVDCANLWNTTQGDYEELYAMLKKNGCITYNRTIVVDKAKKSIKTQDGIHGPYDNINWIYGNKFLYKDGDKYYFYGNGLKKGPYSYAKTGGIGSGYLWIEFYSDYIYADENTFYRVDRDGVETQAGENRYYFMSDNRQHKAVLSDNCRVLTIDNKKYILPFPTDCKIEKYFVLSSLVHQKIDIQNDGSCEIIWNYRSKHNGSPYSIAIKIANDTIYNLYEYSDEPTSKEIQKWVWSGEYDKTDLHYHYDTDHEYMKDKVTDKSGKHNLTIDIISGGVMIDGTKYGDTLPLEVFYDEGANSFVWVTVEGRQVVKYEYAL